jgi:hypothetical protein
VWTGGGRAEDLDDAEVPTTGDLNYNLAARSLDTTNASTEHLAGSGNSNPEVFNEDNTITRRMGPNRPMYKPEYWEQVQKNDQTGNQADPAFNCLPDGVPRMGPPAKIVETPTEMIFIYANTYRLIYMDGRPHTPADKLEGTWKGESIGHWDGDTLVIDTTGFSDDSWLDLFGYFHSDKMHVTEKMTRTGNKIAYQATVEDPQVLLKPWEMNPRAMQLNPSPKATVAEPLPCIDLDGAHLVGPEHH